MEVTLAFGKTGLKLELPEGPEYLLLEAKSATGLADAPAAIAAALDAPVNSPPLEALARGKRTAAISVCDITRPVPNRVILPPLLERLERGGIPREGIVILIATGLHRGATQEEVAEILGPEIAAAYRWGNHAARELAEHRDLGRTAGGSPVYIDERFVAADLRITVGFIEPHLMLGFSGGRKLIVPGLAARETIEAIHSPKFLRDPRTCEGSIRDNPLHYELLEIARMAGHDFMVDVALTRERGIAGVFAGDPVEAHKRGVAFVSRVMLQKLDRPVDAVITTGAGYPLDLTFYQSLKGVTAAQHVVREGGKILLMSACGEGAGAPEFCGMLKRFPTFQGFLDYIDRSPVIIDQWQLEKLALAARKAGVCFHIPGVPAEYHPTLWGPMYESAAEAVEALVRPLGPRARVAVIPDGPYVLARAN